MEAAGSAGSSAALGSVRAESLVCGVLAGALILLGGGWPGLFTVGAVLALPAPRVALFGLMAPRRLLMRPRWRSYLRAVALRAVASGRFEVAWLGWVAR
jgi:hypothetical protein